MIKGCQRKMIMIRGTGGSIYETAYFVMKPEGEYSAFAEGDMVKEALRIIGENIPRQKYCTVNKKSLFCRLLAFLSGAVFGGGIVGILWLILH
ncbi:MAG: hypothetical protein MR471_08195 [Clostridia bacterium]|nr:hypothetical protein [Clostridia bacterium]MDY3785329.1 hypothetical protein [Eubacteriales bacterium]